MSRLLWGRVWRSDFWRFDFGFGFCCARRCGSTGAGAGGEMTREEALQFCADIIRTPVGSIDEHSPLAQEVAYDLKGGRRVKALNKLDALQTLAKFMGWMSGEKEAPQQEDTMTAWIRRIRERE